RRTRWGGRRPVGEGAARGQARGQVEQDQRLAEAGVAVQEMEVAARQSAGPEPVDARGLEIGDIDEWHGESSPEVAGGPGRRGTTAGLVGVLCHTRALCQEVSCGVWRR